MIKTVLKPLIVILAALSAMPVKNVRADEPCKAPALICKAAANQDRSLYVRDHSRYEQKMTVERFKTKDGKEKQDELRETAVMVEPGKEPDKTGRVPVDVRVISDTDKSGVAKQKVDPNAKTLLSFGAVMDLAFFPLLPEKIKYYDFQEVVPDRKNERWYRFIPKPGETEMPLAAGVVELDPDTGEVLTIKIEGLHNLDKLDKEANKLRAFYATIDYSQFEGALRMPTLASGGGESNVSRFSGSFRFRFQEGKYLLVSKVD
ncbi:MAG TPA: hypothetical protein VEZ90_12580 [Blastocatellia bacterium]|nr:hypothetical protein [Blastocatellia bacterium]